MTSAVVSFDAEKVSRYIEQALHGFMIDRADSEYQRGYLAAHHVGPGWGGMAIMEGNSTCGFLTSLGCSSTTHRNSGRTALIIRLPVEPSVALGFMIAAGSILTPERA